MIKNQLKILKKLVVGIVMVLLVSVSPNPFFSTQKAEALFGVGDSVFVVGGKGTWEETFSAKFSGISAAIDATLQQKDLVLDGIAWQIVNITLQNMARSTVEWINNGFEGSPTFIGNLDKFLLNAADQAAGDFIRDLGLGFFCSPFRLDIQFALLLQYQQGRNFEAACTLTDVVDNIDDFVNGNFAAGGWDGWFSLVTEPANNPYGALVLAQGELDARLTNARGEALTLAGWGDGFLSMQTCSPLDDPGGLGQSTPDNPKEDCVITTPGTLIEDHLNRALGSGQNRLELADEINEIVGALFAQLAQQAFAGAGGLLGLSGGDYNYDGTSYLYAMTQPPEEVYGLEDDSLDPIESSIEAELDYIAGEEAIIALVDNTEEYLDNSSCSVSSLELPNSLQNARIAAEDGIFSATENITELRALQIAYEATKDPSAQKEIFDQYLDLQSSGQLHDVVEITTLEFDLIAYQDIAAQFRSQVDIYCSN